jgi:hypothetical protein
MIRLIGVSQMAAASRVRSSKAYAEPLSRIR